MSALPEPTQENGFPSSLHWVYPGYTYSSIRRNCNSAAAIHSLSWTKIPPLIDILLIFARQTSLFLAFSLSQLDISHSLCLSCCPILLVISSVMIYFCLTAFAPQVASDFTQEQVSRLETLRQPTLLGSLCTFIIRSTLLC